MTTYEDFCADAHPRLVAAFTHHFGDRYLAEELAQEALVRVAEHWGRVSRMDAPVGWAYRVGCNVGTSLMRRRGAERRAIKRRERFADTATHFDPDTPDRLAVQAALAELTDAQRRAVIARYSLGLTSAEAADSLGTTAGSVRVQAHKGLARMRDALTDRKEALDA